MAPGSSARAAGAASPPIVGGGNLQAGADQRQIGIDRSPNHVPVLGLQSLPDPQFPQVEPEFKAPAGCRQPTRTAPPNRVRENCWSASTPIRITEPITAKLSELGMPSRLTRFCSTCSRMVPSTTPRIEPSPPRSEQP